MLPVNKTCKRRVHVYGHLKKVCGRQTFELYCSGIPEALRMLEANFPGKFFNAMREGEYHLTRGGNSFKTSTQVSVAELAMRMGPDDIHIMPATKGSKRGGWMALAGLVVLSIATYGAAASLGGAAAFGGGVTGFAQAAYYGMVSGATIMGVSAGTVAAFGAALTFSGISQMLAPVPKLDKYDKENTQSFLFNGAVNSIEQGNPVPIVYGRMIVGSVTISGGVETEDLIKIGTGYNNPYGWPYDEFGNVDPFYGSKGGGAPRKPYEETDSLRSKSVARIVDLISEGEIVGLVNGAKSVYLNNTVVQNPDDTYNFKGVTLETRVGLPDQDPLPGFPSVENEVAVGQEVRADTPVVRAVSNTAIDAIRVRIVIPALLENKDNGDIVGSSVTIKIEVQNNGGGWQEYKTDTIVGKCTSDYERTYRVELAKDFGPWNVRVSRSTPDSATLKITNKTFWAGYTELIEEKLIYPDSALVGLTFDAELFGQAVPTRSYDIKGLKVKIPSNYDPITREYTGFWDGTFTTAWTDNPAWCLYDLLTNTKHGLGRTLPADKLDKTAFYLAGQYCDELVSDGNESLEPRFRLNTVINTREDAYQVLATVASMMRGMFYWGGGVINLTQDRPDSAIKLVTPANVINGLFTYQSPSLRSRHSVIKVTYNDPHDMYKPAISLVEDPAQIDRYGIEEDDVVAYGTTYQSQAQRYGLWIMDNNKNATDTVTYRAGWDHCDVRPGHIVAVADPTHSGVGNLHGRVLEVVDATHLKLDREFTFVNGKTYHISVVLEDKTIATRTVTNAAGTTDTVTVNSALPVVTPAVFKGTIWMISIINEVAPRYFRVVANVEAQFGEYEITAVLHDPNKYARIEQGLNLAPDRTSLLPDQQLVKPPTNMQFTKAVVTNPDRTQINLTVSWQAPDDPNAVRYIIRYRHDRQEWRYHDDTTGLSTVIQDIQGGSYDFQVQAVNRQGVQSSPLSGSYTLSDLPDIDIAIVSGLELFGQGNNTVFGGKHAKFAWRINSTTGSQDLGSERYGADSGWRDHYFRDYEVTIHDADDGRLLRTEHVADPLYQYTFEKNVEDSINGVARRSFTIKVCIRDRWNRKGPAAYLTVQNQAPMIPTGISLTPAVKQVFLRYDRPLDTDWVGALVWASDTAGFTPSDANLVYDGTDTFVALKAESPTLYIRVAAYDGFGKSGLNISQELSASPLDRFDLEAPAPPTGVAVASTVTTENDGGIWARLVVTWNANTETDLAHYEVAIAEFGGSFIDFPIGTNRLEVRVKLNTVYQVKVRALDNSSNRSAYSTTVAHQTARDTTPPGQVLSAAATASFKNIWLSWINPADADLSHVDIYENTVNDRATATHIASSFGTAFTRSDLPTGTTRYYWFRAVDTSGNVGAFNSTSGVAATTLGVSTADYQNLSIVNAHIMNGTIDDAKIANLSAAKLVAGTALAGSITVNGQALTTLQTYANDPAPRINANTTQIDPGRILIAGGVSLANWRSGTDLTQINGGAIAANTVTANKLTVGARGLTIQSIEFTPNSGNHTVSWSAGTISWTGDTGGTDVRGISAGTSPVFGGSTIYVYWLKGQTSLFTTLNVNDLSNPDVVPMATYRGGVNLVANYGRTIIDGSQIITNSITANQLSTGTLITQTAQIADGIITSAKIGNLSADNINAGFLSVDRLQVNSINTDKIAPNAATRVYAASAYWAFPNQYYWQNAITLDGIEVPEAGNSILLNFWGIMKANDDPAWMDVALWSNIGLVQHFDRCFDYDGDNDQLHMPLGLGHLFVAPSAGTYSFAWAVLGFGDNGCRLEKMTASAIVFKR